MDVVEWMHLQLQHDLNDTERNMLTQLNAQGLAKINVDVIHGVPVEETMRTLTSVYQHHLAWRRHVMEHLPTELSTQKRTVLTEQLVFLRDCYRFGLLGRFVDADGNLDHHRVDLEALSEEYWFDRLEQDAVRLQTLTGVRVLPHRLVPTTAAPMMDSHSHVGDDAVVLILPSTTLKSESVRLSLNPFVTWFDESATSPILVSVTPAPAIKRRTTKNVRFAFADITGDSRTGKQSKGARAQNPPEVGFNQLLSPPNNAIIRELPSFTSVVVEMAKPSSSSLEPPEANTFLAGVSGSVLELATKVWRRAVPFGRLLF